MSTGAGTASRRLVRTGCATPVGDLTLTASEAGLAGINFDAARWPAATPSGGDAEVVEGGDPLLDAAAEQILAYFAGERHDFTVPLDLAGQTDFRRRVFAAMRAIPFGAVASYGELAAEIGQPRAARAVGGACNANPLPIVIPCHRVVAADGGLGGYGSGLGIKRFLLRLESAPVAGLEPAG